MVFQSFGPILFFPNKTWFNLSLKMSLIKLGFNPSEFSDSVRQISIQCYVAFDIHERGSRYQKIILD